MRVEKGVKANPSLWKYAWTIRIIGIRINSGSVEVKPERKQQRRAVPEKKEEDKYEI